MDKNISNIKLLILVLSFFCFSITKPMGSLSLGCKIASVLSLSKTLLFTHVHPILKRLDKRDKNVVKLEKVSNEEEEFVYQTLKEQNTPNYDSIKIVHHPHCKGSYACYDKTISIPREKQPPGAYARNSENQPITYNQLPRINSLLSLPQEDVIKVIKNLSQATILDMELNDALGYKKFITQKIDDATVHDNSSTSLEEYQKALLVTKKSLEMHRSSIMHEAGHITLEHTTGIPFLKAFLVYGSLSYIISTKFAHAITLKVLQRAPGLIQYIGASALSHYATKCLVAMGNVLYQRHQEKSADNYSIKKNQIIGLYNVYLLQRITLHYKLNNFIKKATPSEKKHPICRIFAISKNSALWGLIERFFCFLMDPVHLSDISNIKRIEKQLKHHRKTRVA